jgi:3-isopropylmalate/(R)-2-methylmalate dehydratase large subunit
VSPGENVWVNVDVLMTHDISGPGSIGIFKREFGPDAKVFNCCRLPPFFFFFASTSWILSLLLFF